MNVYEKEFDIPLPWKDGETFAALGRAINRGVEDGETPIRFAISATHADHCRCELGVLSSAPDRTGGALTDFIPRTSENTEKFTAVLLIPTGIGCEIGGHAGDSGPVARLLGAACDRVILHPNAVNGSDINEMPENALYVEGSVLCRFLQGTVALQPVRSNRVLVVMDTVDNKLSYESVINSVNAARATYGFHCPKIIALAPPVKVIGEYTTSGRAGGRVEGLDRLLAAVEAERGTFDAVALSGSIEVKSSVYVDYLHSDGANVNPIGGVEAIFTHAVSHLLNVPSAHAPLIIEDEALYGAVVGMSSEAHIVDPRLAAEIVSLAFIQCLLKGLSRSPRILTRTREEFIPGTLSVSDVSCLVIPDSVLGLPVFAALEQGIPVIAVRENRNAMRNDLARLPWRPGQYIPVETYLEAAGAVAALRAGISLESLRRPLACVPVSGP
jgi:hypothetical protein